LAQSVELPAFAGIPASMERPTAVMLMAAALYAGSLLETPTAFSLPASETRSRLHGAALPGTAHGLERLAAERPSMPNAWGSTLRSAAAMLSIAAAAGAVSKAQIKSRSSAKVKMQVARSPIEIYSNALMEAATKQKETVMVVKDLMGIKKLYADGDWIEQKLGDVSNAHWLTDLQVADEMCTLFQPLESSVAPKFVTYLAKKRRLNILKEIVLFTVKKIYDSQSIVPVVVRSATPLTDKQKESIKEKMQQRTGAKDVKLVTRISPDLLAGFVVEFGFQDPEALEVATEVIDCSLSNLLDKAAINKGVVSAV